MTYKRKKAEETMPAVTHSTLVAGVIEVRRRARDGRARLSMCNIF